MSLEETQRGPATPRARAPAAITRGSRFLRYLLVGLDAAGFVLAWTVAAVVTPTGERSWLAIALSAVVLVASGLSVFRMMGLYRSRICTLRVVEYVRVFRSCFILALLGFAVAALADSVVTQAEVARGAALTFLFVTLLRSAYRTWLANQRWVGQYLRSVLLVGAGAEAAQLATLLTEHPELGYRTVAVVGDEREALAHGLAQYWYGDLDEGLTVLADAGISGAIVCGGDLPSSSLNHIVQDLLRAGAHVQLSSGLHGVDIARLRPSPLAHEPFFYVERMRLAGWQLRTKRAIDLVLASVLLTLALPVLAVAAIGIKLYDRGPVLFKQWRVGRDGAPFLLYKLRTMRENAEDEAAGLAERNMRDGPLAKFLHDPRVTAFGRILRMTSIDEIPQLWNVLNGTMSLVGPRPALEREVAHFDDELRSRDVVRPGVTGLWQVEARDNPSFAAYRRFDLFYLENWSVTLDFVILLATVESMVSRGFRGMLHLGEELPSAPPQYATQSVPRHDERDMSTRPRCEKGRRR